MQVPTHPWTYRQNDGWGRPELGVRGCVSNSCQGLGGRWGEHQTPNTQPALFLPHTEAEMWDTEGGGRGTAQHGNLFSPQKAPQQPPPAATGPLCPCGWTEGPRQEIFPSSPSYALCTAHLHLCSEQNTSTSPGCIFTRFCHNTNKKEDTPVLHVYMSHLLLFY